MRNDRKAFIFQLINFSFIYNANQLKMKIIHIISVIVITVIAIFAAFFLFTWCTAYRPKPNETLSENKDFDILPQNGEFNLLIWNIGYCGLDSKMDFFYDGGKMVRPTKDRVLKSLSKIISFLWHNENLDFIMLQEVDQNSKRSYHINETDSIHHILSNYHGYFAKNYDVAFVPVPVTNPMGKVFSGIATFSRFKPQLSMRYSYPGKFPWPKNLFMFNRCCLVNYYPLANGKKFVLINTHNSAFDTKNILKPKEMAFLKKFILNEYQKGNYVMVGGDWNQSPNGLKPQFENFNTLDLSSISKDFTPSGWQWLFDPRTPSNRRVDKPYNSVETLTTVIDMYLISPNIEPVAVQTINTNFAWSDHQPVFARVRLK